MRLFAWLIRNLLPLLPRSVVWTVARRYVAGDDLDAALRRIRTEREAGFGTIIDVLGEGGDDEAHARAAAAEYSRALEALRDVDPECPISVKPTHVGLLADRQLCVELLTGLCEQADRDGRMVRFEMEDAPTIDATLDVFEQVAAKHPRLGCVIQSRLFRSRDDVDRLLASVRPLNVRLVKGVYLEPESIAWTEDADISRSYVELAERLMEGGAFLGLATHDDVLAEACIAALRRRGLGPDRYEFQVLMGVRRPLAESLRDQGHPVRVYVPYGQDWHAYSLRRLAKNPDLAKHVVRAALGRGR